MSYYKNTETAKEYGVSSQSVANWIENAETGKNNLQVEMVENKLKVLINTNNELELKRLADQGKKYKNSDSFKKVELNDEFYKIFSPSEVLEIAKDLEYSNLLNLKYSYKDRGAVIWDESYDTASPAIKQSVMDSVEYLKNILKQDFADQKWNLIDLGMGNAYPSKSLIESDLVQSYTGVDISEDLIDIALENAKEWNPTIKTSKQICDLENTRLLSICSQVKNNFSEKNLIIYTGSTINNHDNRLKVVENIASGMDRGDLFAITFSLDTAENKTALSYNKGKGISERQMWTLRLLGIDVDSCSVDLEYDSNINSKVKNLRLDKDYQILFKIDSKDRIVNLSTTRPINIWKHYLISLDQMNRELNQNKLKIVNFKIDKSRNYGLVVCEV